jgi:two-component system sensor histidine kinase UhpB
MSLRSRLMAAIFLALVVSFGAGAGLTAWRAGRSVQVELAAALENARRSAAAALAEDPSAATARRVVAALDGSRHVRAELLDASGAVLAASRDDGAETPPAWFMAIAAAPLPAATIPAGSGYVRLVADPANEAGERWRDWQGQAATLALFSLLAAVLCGAVITAGLAPLGALSQGLARLARGEPQPPLPTAGPPEIGRLADAFNRLADAARDAESRNRRLQSQMADIAEEERAEIARDLHDEFGPLLFAITAFAATVARLAESGDAASIPPQARAIQDAAAALQREVRDMLGRLHEPPPDTLALGKSLGQLIAFWRNVQPEIGFELDLSLDEEALTDAVREAMFRAAQEAVSNAVRHGSPRSVRISARTEGGQAALVVEDDGIGGGAGPGFGLSGMRARAASLGGKVDIERGQGWKVAMRLPLSAAPLAIAS